MIKGLRACFGASPVSGVQMKLGDGSCKSRPDITKTELLLELAIEASNVLFRSFDQNSTFVWSLSLLCDKD